MEKSYKISKFVFFNLLEKLIREYKVFAPIVEKYKDLESIELKEISKKDINSIVFNEYRVKEQLRKFFFEPYTKLDKEKTNPRIIIGMKSCDLNAFYTLDGIFLSSPAEPFYKALRDNTIIISSDCTDCLPTCFCSKLGYKPYSESNYDINLSVFSEGYIVEIGSAKGEKLILENIKYFQPVNRDFIIEREKTRQKLHEKVLMNNQQFEYNKDFVEIIRNMNKDKFKQKVEKCVNCAACRNICPTCHCFFLFEIEDFNKIRCYDTCQYTAFARVAGGANPGKSVIERYKNLYSCKFVNKFENFEHYACVGCGRCINACQAKIDIRDVLSAIQN